MMVVWTKVTVGDMGGSGWVYFEGRANKNSSWIKDVVCERKGRVKDATKISGLSN